MSELPLSNGFVTPGAIVSALLGFFIGGASMAFNRAFKVANPVVQGMLRILAILGIMGALGGIAVLLFPRLGLPG